MDEHNLQPQFKLNRVAFGLLITIIIVVIGLMQFTISIDAGNMGVKFDSFTGTDLTKAYGEGIHFLSPASEFILYETRSQTKVEKCETKTSDSLSFTINVAISYRPDPDNLPKLHVTYGQEYYRILIESQFRRIARETVSPYTFEELHTVNTGILQQKIFDSLVASLKEKYVIIDNVKITNLNSD